MAGFQQRYKVSWCAYAAALFSTEETSSSPLKGSKTCFLSLIHI